MKEYEEMLKIVQRNRDSRLDLAGGSRLASRQKLHMCQACQKLKRHDSWSTTGQKVQTDHSVTSQLGLATGSHGCLVACKPLEVAHVPSMPKVEASCQLKYYKTKSTD